MKLRQIIGEKMKMTQMPDRYGRVFGVTLVKVTPNVVLKTLEKRALVGFGHKKKLAPSLKGILKGLQNVTPALLKELELGNDKVEAGQEVGIGDVFRNGDLVDVTGISKGKGFAGGVKRWGFAGGPKTHGQSDRWRGPGSIGSGTTPGRVIKGFKMAGHMGVDQVTTAGMEILDIDTENNIVKIKGALPGNSGGVLLLSKSIKKKKAYHEPDIPVIPQLGTEDKTADQSEEQKETVPTEASAPVSENGVTNG